MVTVYYNNHLFFVEKNSVDIVILLDGSEFMGGDNFDIAKKFIVVSLFLLLFLRQTILKILFNIK